MYQSTHSKKEKHFAIEITGSTLIPCGLSLEVFDVSKDGKVGQTTRHPLTLATTSSFTHTSITLTIPDSSLSSLSSSLAWHGRLVFGANPTTTESFVIQKSSIDRYAQTTKENMKWWLPLVISLIVLLVIGMLVVFICWRRRNQNKSKQESEPQEQELQPEDKVEVEDNAVLNLQNMTDKASFPAFTDSETTVSLPTSNHQPLKSAHQPVMEVLSCGEKCEVVTIPVADTLFNKLHRQGSSFDKRAAQKQLTKGVNALVYLKPDTSILLTLSPHTVLMDKLNNVFLQVNMDINESQTTIKDEKEKTEGQRWQAPEVTEKKDRVDPNKASVFSLGLVLWEIETGLVPFGEQDAVNACRQVTAGILPSMEKVVDAEFADLLLKCLSVNPVDRPTLGELSSFLETHSFVATVENSKGEL
ncbi:hypothetical protein BLNAU_18452 [Blattamonas nauphoetae]|uniref:Protein kinase domain-containing protein n=1 Tax=Blattamonas nauphoetae TaxID=2049346 RepID=A0ABQ9X8Q5_9EUKA|nr:hypothetical protein BLNAU_18452 [Blattamonas nauphoetae]